MEVKVVFEGMLSLKLYKILLKCRKIMNRLGLDSFSNPSQFSQILLGHFFGHLVKKKLLKKRKNLMELDT